jgi:hypothetical protein
MDVATETLYSKESPDAGGFNSAGFKLDRLARTFRKMAITNSAANISIVGYLSKNSMDDFDANLSRMVDRIKATRDRLTFFGVWEKSITGYLPLQAAPITEDLIIVTARDTKVELFPGIKSVPFGDVSIDPDDDAKVQGRIVVDPFAAIQSYTQLLVGYTLIPRNFQGVTPIDPLNPLSTQHQFSFTITRQYHPKNASGLELTPFQGSVTFDDKWHIVNVQAGTQEALAWVPKLLGGWIQISGFVQQMAGLNWNQTIKGQALIVQLQAGIGAQIVVTPNFSGGGVFKFLRDRVQIVIQGVATANRPIGPGATDPFVGGQASSGLTFVVTLDGPTKKK